MIGQFNPFLARGHIPWHMQSQQVGFQAQHSPWMQNNARLEAQLASTRQQNAIAAQQAQRDMCVLNEKSTALQEENAALSNKLHMMSQESVAMQRQLQDEIKKTTRLCKMEESRRLEAEEMCEKIAAECATLKAEFEAKIVELNTLTAFLKEELATSKKTYLQQIQTLGIELNEQQLLNESLGSEVEKQRQLYERQIANVNKQRDDFKALCEQLKVDLKIKQDEVATLVAHEQTELARISQEKQGFWITLQDKTAECRDLATKLQQLKERSASQQEALTISFENRINALQELKDTEIEAIELGAAALQRTFDEHIVDKERLILENKELRSKLATWQEENALVRDHMQFTGKMWNQLSDQLVEDKASVEKDNMQLKQVLQFAKDHIVAHEIESTERINVLKSFSDRYLA